VEVDIGAGTTSAGVAVSAMSVGATCSTTAGTESLEAVKKTDDAEVAAAAQVGAA